MAAALGILITAPSSLHFWLQHLVAVSVELEDAPIAATPSLRVQAWLRNHKSTIERAELRYNIDRRAIASVIAWEALFDIEPSYYGGFAKFAGPGKVHYKEFRVGEGRTAAFETEQMHILPRRTFMQRVRMLETADGAVEYIAGIMSAFDKNARTARNSSIKCDVPLLATLYSAYLPSEAKRRFISVRSLSDLRNNDVGIWARSSVAYLTQAVGTSRVCRDTGKRS